MEKLKIEIKKELISYYDTIKSEIDIKTIELVESFAKSNNSTHENNGSEYEIIKCNKILIQLIEKTFNLNIEQINRHLNDSDNNNIFDNKEKIKRNALKNYAIYIKSNELKEKFRISNSRLGILLQSNWYIDENQLIFIK
jgi:hypothetical protein